MKILIAAFAALFPMAAMAEPTAEIFAAAGCDTANLVPVVAADGEVLYWQNINGGGCKADRGSFGADVAAARPVRPEEPVLK